MINRAVMARWADATRNQRWDEADELWAQLIVDWLKPPAPNQRYWNQLLDRRMAALERKEERSAIDDAEWDSRHEEMGR